MKKGCTSNEFIKIVSEIDFAEREAIYYDKVLKDAIEGEFKFIKLKDETVKVEEIKKSGKEEIGREA